MKRHRHIRPGMAERYRALGVVVVVVLLALPRLAAADATPSKIVVLYANMENFLDPALDIPANKPPAARERAIKRLAEIDADIALLVEVGGLAAAREINAGLARHGREYPFFTVVEGDDAVRHIMVFAKREPLEVDHETAATYTIRNQTVPVRRGFANCLFEWPNGYRLRLIGAHLKSKVYHPLGQTDIRRYEARQLRYLINRHIVDDDACNLLLLGDFNDAPNSSPLNELFARRRRKNGQLFDLRPVDARRQAWTHYWNVEDVYARIDYALVSLALLPEIDLAATRIVDVPDWRDFSDHRPLVVILRPRDQPLAPEIEAAFERNIRVRDIAQGDSP